MARELKPLLPSTSIVFLTLDPGIRDLALAVGAVAHISKDASPQQMLKVLRGAAQQHERRKVGSTTLTEKERALADALLAAKLITEQQLDQIVAQRQPRELLSSVVVRSRLVPDVQLAQILSRVSGRPLMTLAPRSESSDPSGARNGRANGQSTSRPGNDQDARDFSGRISASCRRDSERANVVRHSRENSAVRPALQGNS